MLTKAVHKLTKILSYEDHVIRVGLLPGRGKRKVVCASYYDGSVVFGINAVKMKHPQTRLSFAGQNTILWIANFPFTVRIHAEDLPDRLFFQMPAWHSVKGKDQLHRVQTGPLNPEKSDEIKAGTELKYSIAKRVTSGSLLQDVHCQALDPHIIVEP